MNERPLSGLRVLVTRPEHQADDLCRAIEDAGGAAIRYPVLKIVPMQNDELRRSAASLTAPEIAIFVSRNAVRFGIEHVPLDNVRLAAIGSATAEAIDAAGRVTDIVPEQRFDSEGLLEMPEMKDVAGKTILIVRGDNGRELLGTTLAGRGAVVEYLPVYRRQSMPVPDGTREAFETSLRDGGIDAVTIMSVATFRRLVASSSEDALARLKETPLVGPGERVIKEVSDLLPGIPTIQANGPRPDDIVEALIAWRRSGTNQ